MRLNYSPNRLQLQNNCIFNNDISKKLTNQFVIIKHFYWTLSYRLEPCLF